jgi:hypothetical protein
MKGWKAGLMAILVGLGMAVLVGCGGSKAPVKSTQQSISPLDMSAGYGTVVLSVQWSKGKGRVIPEATERIVARLKRSGMTLFEKVIERGQTQVVFEKVPVGEWVLEAEAWGSGEVVKQLVHAKGVVMAGNQPVSGAQVRLTVGTQTYTATTDGQGKFDFGLVEWFWGGELRVTASGYPEWVGWVNAFDFTRSSEGLVVDMGSGGISRKRQWTQEVVLASGATSFSLGANENKQVEVILASKLTDLHVTPSEIRLGVGSEVEVAVQGKIEQEAGWTPNYVLLILVPLSGGKVNWQIADSSVASLSATSGLSVTVRGLREGQTTLTVTDTESGKSKQVRVEVTQDVSTAKSIVQMLRDFGMTTKSTLESESMNIHDTLIRLAFPARIIGDSLIGESPARYREVQDEQGNLILQRVGDAPDSKTWIVESAVPGNEGLSLTVNAEHDVNVFDPQNIGRITFSVRSSSQSSLRYDGTLTFNSNSMSGSVEIREDKILANFTGNLASNSVQGNLQYQSDTLTFTGSVSCNWENEEVLGFGSEWSPVQISEVPKGSFILQGNWTPKVGRPAGVDLQMTSNPQGNAPHASIQLTINYGDQKLAGTITGTLDIKNNQSYGFKSGNLDMTHTPSNFKVQVSWERGKPVSGKIVTEKGQKVADIGEARNLGLPDLGDVLIVKYSDKTFETLESVLPRSRLGGK